MWGGGSDATTLTCMPIAAGVCEFLTVRAGNGAAWRMVGVQGSSCECAARMLLAHAVDSRYLSRRAVTPKNALLLLDRCGL